ncbi:hypothetical protein BUALT_Bualt09G0133200 [Buddleja alternifolia]|uniref:Uncharacterized protein n=1 Tax=Buddleja alternifolia TaxID=168488 RepID=A0AAV6X3P5_9LAMI|nr:hypothetical protein BUALT_Bualt09G0133200 [Buddleja alternifolia]
MATLCSLSKANSSVFMIAASCLMLLAILSSLSTKRWHVFRGESTDDKDLLFDVKQSSLWQLKTKLDVILAPSIKQDVSDFRIEGSWFERSCVIYAGNNIIAQMHRKHTASSILLGKDKFGVTVYPNVDYAFIVALIVILEEINTDRSGQD